MLRKRGNGQGNFPKVPLEAGRHAPHPSPPQYRGGVKAALTGLRGRVRCKCRETPRAAWGQVLTLSPCKGICSFPEAVPKGAKGLELNPAFQTLHPVPHAAKEPCRADLHPTPRPSSPERAWGAFHTSWCVLRALSHSTWGPPVRTGERNQKTSGSCSWRTWGLKQEVPE